MNKLGHTIKSTRVAMDLSLSDVAQRVGITAIQLDSIENDKEIPSEEILRALARVLGAGDLLELYRTTLAQRNAQLAVEEQRIFRT